MRSSPILALTLMMRASCSLTEPPGVEVSRPVWDAASQSALAAAVNERRPFKSLLDALDPCTEALQNRFLVDLAKGVPPRCLAAFSSEPVPHWEDLIDELLCRSKMTLLHHLLEERSLNFLLLGELGVALGKRGDAAAFDILLKIVDEEVWEKDDESGWKRCNPRRHEAVRGLGEYQGFSWSESRAFRRLERLLAEDQDPVVRGFAAMVLGDSRRREAEDALRRALSDPAEITLDCNESANEIDSVGARAAKSLKRIQKERSNSPSGRLE